MGSLPGKFSPFAAILSLAALAVFSNPASSQSLMASSNYSGKAAAISNLRVGSHPDKTRIVLDVSQPTDLSYKVSNDGKTIRLELPKASWQANGSQSRYTGGSIIGFKHNTGVQGSTLTLQTNKAIRIKRPFFVSPGENRGHRIVIDMAPAPVRMTKKTNTSLVASLDNIGALPQERIEVAQAAGARNPYIQRAFPQSNSRTQPMLQQTPHQTPKRAMPAQQGSRFMGLSNTYARGSLGLHMINETSSEGGSSVYDAEFDPGFMLSGALGTKLDNDFRIEGEFFYSNASLKQVSGTIDSTVYNSENVTGDLTTFAFMGNVAYDISNNSKLTPYLMGGLGLAALNLNDYQVTDTSIADDMDWVFAMQLGGGVTFDLDSRTKIEVGYRYFETQDPEFSDKTGTPFESVFSSHNFLVGARVDLN
jgi:opacity protein-like surface antigen